jgi:hypothetical protein
MDQVSLEALLAESMRLERELVPDFTRLMRNSIERTSGMPQPRTSSVPSTLAVLIDPDWLSLFAQLNNEFFSQVLNVCP